MKLSPQEKEAVIAACAEPRAEIIATEDAAAAASGLPAAMVAMVNAAMDDVGDAFVLIMRALASAMNQVGATDDQVHTAMRLLTSGMHGRFEQTVTAGDKIIAGVLEARS